MVRLEDGEAGLSVRTIKRRLTTVSGLFDYLVARGDVGVRANPVPRGMAARRAGATRRGAPLLRAPRTLPRVLLPAEVDALMSALRTHRDQAMVEAMLLGGLRRCEVLGLRLGDVGVGERRVFIAEGKGGHQRIVPISPRFFATLGRYLDLERPADSASDRLFLVLKGPNRGRALSSHGIDEIIRGARRRAELDHLTCHQLRHTCLTRLREAGMALEAVWAGEGRNQDTLGRFFDELGAGRATRLTHVSCDGAEWIHALVRARAPQAEICLDPFHVVAWAMKALDKVRVRTMTRAGMSDRHAMWAVRKNPPDLTTEQRTSLAQIADTNRTLYRAYLLKEQLREVFRVKGTEGRHLLAGWLSWASHSRIPEFVALARSIRRYRDMICNTLDHGLSNARSEATNTHLRALTKRAYGFHSPDALIAMALLTRGGLCPPLPGRK